MSRAFVDTSAVLALLNPGDAGHRQARNGFASLRPRDSGLVSSSYVLVETYALLGRRLGAEAVRSFRSGFEPLLRVVWVDETLHEAGLDRLLAGGTGRISLVDAVSFAVMRRERIEEAFALDGRVEKEGFKPVA